MNSAVSSVIEDIRNYVTQLPSDVSRSGIISAVVNNNSYYLVNIRYPNSITASLLEDITSILIDNPTITTLDVYNFAKNIVYVEKVVSTQPKLLTQSSKLFQILNYCMMPVVLDINNTVLVLRHVLGGNNYLKISAETSQTDVDFKTISRYYYDTESSSRFKQFNDLVGRIGIISINSNSTNTNKVENEQLVLTQRSIVPSGQISVEGFTTRLWSAVSIKNMLVPSIGSIKSDLISELSVDVKLKLHAIISNILSDAVSYGVLGLDYNSRVRTYQPTTQSSIKYKLPSSKSNTLVLSTCQHYQSKKDMTSDEFLAAYIKKLSYKAYCKICGERIIEYDDMLDVLDKSFGAISTAYTNFKLFNTMPYKNYTTAIQYVIEKNNRVEELFKITTSDTFLSVAKTIIDILLHISDNREDFLKKYSKQINEGYVFLPRLTNQLFMTEMYEKEKFGEIKSLNLFVIYTICLFIRKSNFMLSLSLYFKTNAIKKIYQGFMKKMIFADQDLAYKTLEFYLSEKIYSDKIQSAIDALNRIQLKEPQIVKEMQLNEVIDEIDTVEDITTRLEESGNLTADYQRTHLSSKVTFQQLAVVGLGSSSIGSSSIVSSSIVSSSIVSSSIVSSSIALLQIPYEKLESEIQRLIPIISNLKLQYEYWYDDKRVTQITFLDNTTMAKISVDDNKYLVNIYTDSKLTFKGNNVAFYLTDGFPTRREVSRERFELYKITLRMKVPPHRLIPDKKYLPKNIDELMAYGYLYLKTAGQLELLKD